MAQALEVHRSGALKGVAIEKHLPSLIALADQQKLAPLRTALRQRYPQEAA